MEQTNREFARDDKAFRKACEALEPELKPSVRQASKWRRKRGLAYQQERRLAKKQSDE